MFFGQKKKKKTLKYNDTFFEFSYIEATWNYMLISTIRKPTKATFKTNIFIKQLSIH